MEKVNYSNRHRLQGYGEAIPVNLRDGSLYEKTYQ